MCVHRAIVFVNRVSWHAARTLWMPNDADDDKSKRHHFHRTCVGPWPCHIKTRNRNTQHTNWMHSISSMNCKPIRLPLCTMQMRNTPVPRSQLAPTVRSIHMNILCANDFIVAHTWMQKQISGYDGDGICCVQVGAFRFSFLFFQQSARALMQAFLKSRCRYLNLVCKWIQSSKLCRFRI